MLLSESEPENCESLANVPPALVKALRAAGASTLLETWRSSMSGNGGPAPEGTLAEIRAALADDLDAPRALAAVDAWAELSLAGTAEPVEGAPGVISRAVNALLGIRL